VAGFFELGSRGRPTNDKTLTSRTGEVAESWEDKAELIKEEAFLKPMKGEEWSTRKLEETCTNQLPRRTFEEHCSTSQPRKHLAQISWGLKR